MWEDAYYSNKSNLKKTEYHTNSDIINNIDKVLNNIKERTPVRLRDYTPDILVQNGVKNLPMYENPSHIRKNILTEQEAIKLGLSVGENDHYHGLGKDLYIKAIDSLDNPRVIFKNKNNKDYLILTLIKDNSNNNIVVPIEIETTTNINRVKIDINRIKSVYGYKTINNINLNDYIKYNIKNNNFTKIYEQKKERGTGFSTAAGSFLEKNIPQSDNNVNNDISSTKYSIPTNKNNTRELNNSSFSLEQRVSGDKLLDTQDLIEEIKTVGAKVDKNGYVTLYHQTTNENADKIRQTGKMFAKEPYVYFSTSENASQSF